MKKKLRQHLDMYQQDATFYFFLFSPFSVRKSFKMAETGPKTVKIPIFTPSGQNMQLRNKSHQINKHTLYTLATKYEPCKI